MSDNDPLQTLERMVEFLLAAHRGAITTSRIREMIAQCRLVPMCDVSDGDAEALARRFETRHSVTMEIGSVLVERDYQPWLEGELAGIDFYYWNRYRKLLELKRLSPHVISTLHQETDRILGLLENPAREGPWGRRGMVVGDVQSGKTANYTGLICKAADAGYRLIVVIAGVNNNLRNQTQRRIDEGFVGRDSARLLSKREDKFVGVGNFDSSRRPATFTTSHRDFNKQMATGAGIPLHNLKEPAVLVIKKHPKTLENLVEWLREHNAGHQMQTVDVPMLLIDDEADNASINVAYKAGDISKINGRIRELLQMFSRSCYVGYTATPFANIFIDPDTDDDMRGQDLFPRDFIVSLEAPTNYFGATRVFHDDSEATIRHIDDHVDTLPLDHKIDHQLDALPESMITAVRTFVVARAIRLIRGHRTQHCSMLINTSRFTRVQGQVRSLVQQIIEDIQASARVNGALTPERALKDSTISSLYAVWEEEFGELEYSWAQVQRELLNAAAPVRVVEVNKSSHGTLAYDEYEDTGLSVIAIGGFSLSRGLTLEGLMVSYFLRNSRMYDTLMQMGRWFGYRPEYEDLCRVWMPEETEGWYAHVSDATDQLREELRAMAAANATPVEFGLKVRAHPTTLEVTARNKMGAGERIVVSVGLKNQFIETAVLSRAALAKNRDTVRILVSDLSTVGFELRDAEHVSTGWLLRQVPVAQVKKFLIGFVNHHGSLLTDTGPVTRYITDREDAELAEWDVLFAGLQESSSLSANAIVGLPIHCQRRTAGTHTDHNTLYVSNKQRVASRGIERTGLTSSDIAELQRKFRDDKTNKPNSKGQWNYPDRIYRAKRPRPLLIIHLLEVVDGEEIRVEEEPVVAWSISFPDTDREEQRVEYVVTATWAREHSPNESEEELEEIDA